MSKPDPFAEAGVRRRLNYRLIDVFTDRPFGGNQLAVFTEAVGVEGEAMQRIARELNLSETVFATSRDAPGEWDVRIFTPTMEHPFAGHPTVGAALVLSQDPGADAGEECRLVLHEAVGPVPVVVRTEGGTRTATFSVPRDPTCHPQALSTLELAALLGLASDEICEGDWVPRSFTCGVPFQFVCVRDARALARVRLDRALWAAHVAQTAEAQSWSPHLYVFTREGIRADVDLQSRMFAPAMGIDEDPATGGAAAALAGFLAVAEGLKGPRRWTIAQGVEMGRPSRLELTATVKDGRATAVTVGGGGVPMGDGYLMVT